MFFNGGLDTPGKLENDGSDTLVLIRNRPGITEADPTNPLGLRWGKDIKQDIDYIVPVFDDQDGSLKAQVRRRQVRRRRHDGPRLLEARPHRHVHAE